MILADIDILNSIQDGNLTISPFNEDSLRPSSYCLHLGYSVFVYKDLKKTIKISDRNTYPKSQEIKITSKAPYVLAPGDFVLSMTLEEISISKNLTAFLSNVSGLARLGLGVLLSTHVASGFGVNGGKKITLELHNMSKFNLELSPRMRICHLIIAKNQSSSLKGYDDIYPDKYKNVVLSEYTQT